MTQLFRPAPVLLRGLAAPLALGGLFCGLAAGLGPAAVASAAVCQVQGSPQPVSPSGSRNVLSGVAMITSCDTWAVGTQVTAGADAVLIEHFDGTAWKVSDPPAQLGSGELAAASAVSAGNVYAAGQTVQDNKVRPVVLHWNGTAWATQTLPDLGGRSGDLHGITAVSANDVWAVGDTNKVVGGRALHDPLILHWNGTSWSSVPVPPLGSLGDDIELLGVGGSSARDAWAVGDSFGADGGSVPFILHWDGARWALARSLAPRDAELFSVSATGPHDAWAVGAAVSGSRATPLILHWNGVTWLQVPSPEPGGNSTPLAFLTGVAASSPSSAFAVGQFGSSTETSTLLLRWNGSFWTQVGTPSPGRVNVLAGVDTTSPRDVWAVGEFGQDNSPVRALAFHGF